MDVNEGRSPVRHWSVLLATTGQFCDRLWAGSHGRRQQGAERPVCRRNSTRPHPEYGNGVSRRGTESRHALRLSVRHESPPVIQDSALGPSGTPWSFPEFYAETASSVQADLCRPPERHQTNQEFVSTRDLELPHRRVKGFSVDEPTEIDVD
jgi:hypothetical protein